MGLDKEHSVSSRITSNIDPYRAVTARNNIVLVQIHRNRDVPSHIFLATTFDILDRLQLSTILVSTSSAHVSIALVVDSRSIHAVEADIGARLAKVGAIRVTPDMTLLSLVGGNCSDIASWEQAVLLALANEDIDVAMLSKGA